MILTQVYQATPYSLAPLCGHSTRVSRVGSAVRIILDRPAHALDRLLRAVAGSRRSGSQSRRLAGPQAGQPCAPGAAAFVVCEGGIVDVSGPGDELVDRTHADDLAGGL